MALKLLSPENLDLIRAMLPLCMDRLGTSYYTLEDAIYEAELANERPAVVFRKVGDEFEAGLAGYPVVKLRQRPNSNAMNELHQVMAAAGSLVRLPGSARAVRSRLIEAIERITRAAGYAMIGNVLAEGIHVGKDGAWFDYAGVGSVVTR